MGLYGLLRIVLPIFPEQLRMWQTPLVVLAVVTVVGGAAVALAQRDLKRLLAYSSVNHLGYCLLAVFATAAVGVGQGQEDRLAALSGTVLQMFNHGLTAATLFAFVAVFERRTTGPLRMNQYGGLRQVAPVWAGLMGIAIFSSVGLPGLNGFVGEFLVFRGVFGLVPWAAVLAILGLLLTAIFLMTMLQRVFFGPVREGVEGMGDLNAGERWVLAPVIGLMFLLGIWPQVAVGWFNQTVLSWVEGMPW
jgi:NADH-quinone oxidoreductase subunit M